MLVGMNPAGSRFLHAAMAVCHAALLGSSDEPFLDPIDELARRVRVREFADPVAAHALGELHCLLMIGIGSGVAAAGCCRKVRSNRTR